MNARQWMIASNGKMVEDELIIGFITPINPLYTEIVYGLGGVDSVTFRNSEGVIIPHQHSNDTGKRAKYRIDSDVGSEVFIQVGSEGRILLSDGLPSGGVEVITRIQGKGRVNLSGLSRNVRSVSNIDLEEATYINIGNAFASPYLTNVTPFSTEGNIDAGGAFADSKLTTNPVVSTEYLRNTNMMFVSSSIASVDMYLKDAFIGHMFLYCSSLTSVDLRLTNVTTKSPYNSDVMPFLGGCVNLTNLVLDIQNIDYLTLGNLPALTHVDISVRNIEQSSRTGGWFRGWFNGCDAIEEFSMTYTGEISILTWLFKDNNAPFSKSFDFVINNDQYVSAEYVISLYGMFENSNISDINAEKVLGQVFNNITVEKDVMVSNIFFNASEISKIPPSMLLNIHKITRWEKAFSGSSIAVLPKNLILTSENSDNLNGVFQETPNLRKVEGLEIDSARWNSNNLVSYMFSSSGVTECLDFNTNGLDTYHMFSNCTNLTKVSGRFTGSRNDYLFAGCANLTDISGVEFNNSTPLSLASAFANCVSLSDTILSLIDGLVIEDCTLMLSGILDITTLNNFTITLPETSGQGWLEGMLTSINNTHLTLIPSPKFNATHYHFFNLATGAVVRNLLIEGASNQPPVTIKQLFNSDGPGDVEISLKNIDAIHATDSLSGTGKITINILDDTPLSIIDGFGMVGVTDITINGKVENMEIPRTLGNPAVENLLSSLQPHAGVITLTTDQYNLIDPTVITTAETKGYIIHHYST